MMRLSRMWLLLMLWAFIPFTAMAQIGGSAVVFLRIEPDSRASGMGNAGVALSDDVNAMYWNPAGLGFQRGTEIGITHANWLPAFNANLFYEYGAIKTHLNGIGTVGAHITFLNLGEHECRDENNNECGTFRSYDLAAGASFGRQLSDNLSVGVGARFIYSNLASGQQVGNETIRAGVSTGIDFGMLYRSDPIALGGMEGHVRAGFNLANIGPTIRYTKDDNVGDPIPTNLRFGYAFTLDLDEYNSLTFTNDFNKMIYRVERDTATGEKRVDPFFKSIVSSWQPVTVNLTPNDPSSARTLNAFEQMTIGAGLEYWYNRLVAFRTGYFYENPFNGNRQFVTLGAGVRYNIFGVDLSYVYALEENSPIANQLRFSVLLNFGR